MIQPISYNPCLSKISGMQPQVTFGSRRIINQLPKDVKLAGQEVFDGFVQSASDKNSAENLTYLDNVVIPELRQNRSLFGKDLMAKLNLKKGSEILASAIEKHPKLSGSDLANGLNEALGDFIL